MRLALTAPFASLMLLAPLAVGTAGVVGGCRGTKPPYDVAADPYAPTQVQIADKRLEGKLRFNPPVAQRDEAGLLFVSIPVRAATNRPQIVQYRFRFFDAGGIPLPGGEYQTATLESNTFGRIQGNSTSPRAESYQVEIRSAR